MTVQIRGKEDLIKQVRAMGAQGRAAAQRATIRATFFAQETIVDKITRDIAPHSGASRKPPEDLVTDLVDTGRLRSSWTTAFPNDLTGIVSSNVEYAPILEYGFNGTIQVPASTRFWADGTTYPVKAHTRKVVRPGFFFLRSSKAAVVPFLNKVLAEELGKI